MKYLKPLIYGIALTATTGAAILTTPKTTNADFDIQGLNQQVQSQQSQLDNHQARITNNEKDIKALQDNTNTQPAPDPVVVSDPIQPVQSEPAPTSTPEAASTAEPAPTQSPSVDNNNTADANIKM